MVAMKTQTVNQSAKLVTNGGKLPVVVPAGKRVIARGNSASVVKPVLLLTAGLMLIAAAGWLATQSNPEKQRVKGQRQVFFASQGVEALNLEERRNREAIDRAQQHMAASFSRYHEGVPRYAAELASLGTRYKIAKAMLTDWWSNSNDARKVGTDKFAELVVSDEQLQHEVTAVIAQFASDLEANRNQMLSELQEKVSTAAVPCASPGLGSTNFAGAFTLEAQHLLQNQAVQSPLVGALATGGGFIAGEAATQIVTRLLAAMAARIAAGAVAEGSAVAAGVVLGGEGGTIITPGVGTAVGVAAGIVLGFAVDWWAARNFEEKVTRECNGMLNDMQVSLWSDPDRGLAISFDQVVTITRQCHETALRKIITGGDK